MKYGYVRVSTDCQSLDAQVKQLRAAGEERKRAKARGVEAGTNEIPVLPFPTRLPMLNDEWHGEGLASDELSENRPRQEL
jgi:hypothetical protein